jgi:hypothetical protein
MRSTPILALLLVALAGCAPGPVSVREQGTFFVYAANQDPLKTGRCIVRNTKRQSPALITTEGPMKYASGWEVVVSDGADVLASARIDVATILVSINPRGFDNEKFANDLVHGC